MTASEIRVEICRLQALERQMEEEERNKHREAARKFVGKCYKSNKGKIAKVISIPRTIQHMTGTEYNQYRFPAVFLNYPSTLRDECIYDDIDEFAPLYCDTMYLDITAETPGRNACFWEDQWDEITPEEFDAEFDKCIASFKEQISV